ncbi:MAG: phage tail tube protein [Dehalococcoidales bacterium]|nr:phage tail tube protein [Dehalococcoidales bacterium]
MVTSAIAGYGVVLSRDTNDIAELTNIDGVQVTQETVDVTSHESADGYREYIPTLRDTGEINIEGNFIGGDSDGQLGLEDDLNAGTLQSFTITFPYALSATWTFSAYVTAFKAGGFPVDGKVPFSATLKVSGKPTLGVTAATGPTDIVVTGDSSGALAEVPTYDADVYDYVVDGSGDTKVTVTVTAAGADEITVNGNTVDSGVASSAIDLTPGEITTITVVVKEDGKASQTYTIRVSSASA